MSNAKENSSTGKQLAREKIANHFLKKQKDRFFDKKGRYNWLGLTGMEAKCAETLKKLLPKNEELNVVGIEKISEAFKKMDRKIITTPWKGELKEYIRITLQDHRSDPFDIIYLDYCDWMDQEKEDELKDLYGCDTIKNNNHILAVTTMKNARCDQKDYWKSKRVLSGNPTLDDVGGVIRTSVNSGTGTGSNLTTVESFEYCGGDEESKHRSDMYFFLFTYKGLFK